VGSLLVSLTALLPLTFQNTLLLMGKGDEILKKPQQVYDFNANRRYTLALHRSWR